VLSTAFDIFLSAIEDALQMWLYGGKKQDHNAPLARDAHGKVKTFD